MIFSKLVLIVVKEKKKQEKITVNSKHSHRVNGIFWWLRHLDKYGMTNKCGCREKFRNVDFLKSSLS